MLRMRQIEVFRAVMSTGTVTEASRLLGVSQPAISRMLRYTEDQLGVALFTRQGGRLLPTNEAWTLYPQTERLFSELDDVRRAAEELRHLRTGRLHIAAIPSLGAGLLPATVTRFRRTYPGVNVSLETMVNYEIASRVADNKVDVGLLFGPPDFPNVTSEELFSAEIVCVIPARHAFAGHPHLTWRQLVSVATITLKRRLPIGAVVQEAMQEAGGSSVVIEVSESAVACALARAGAGIAVVDELTANDRADVNLVRRPLEPRMLVSTRMLTSPKRRSSLVVDEFIKLLRADIDARTAFAG